MTRRTARELGFVLVLAAAIRVAYLAFMDLPVFDPWRHLLLVENLRAGRGFTLFVDQPYLWYQSPWYRLCAAFPAWFGMEWIAAGCSIAAVGLLYMALHDRGGGERTALFAAVFLAAAAPVVVFTCHYGAEAFALALTLGGWWWLRARSDLVAAAGAGALFGLAVLSRMNFAFDGVLFLPWLRTPRRGAAFTLGAALPLVLGWWRNHRIISAHEWLFTWDGLATQAAGFDPLSTLLLQRHPAIREALRTLHEQIVATPEWIVDPSGIRWGRLAFMALGVGTVIWVRRIELIAGAAAIALYFLFLEGTLSANFFRLWLPLFPLFAIAVGVAAGRSWAGGVAGRRTIAGGLLLLPLLAVAPELRPVRMLPLEMLRAPEDLLGDETRFLVNSGFYHPESLIWAHRDREFAGLPLDPAQLESFRTSYPEWTTILWHDFSVQDRLADALTRDGWAVQGAGHNAYGRRYVVLRRGP